MEPIDEIRMIIIQLIREIEDYEKLRIIYTVTME